MNRIEAAEGTAKAVLTKYFEIATEYRMDASEYIRNVKAVIDAVTEFVKSNPEISDTPDILRDILYDFAKQNWLAGVQKIVEPDQAEVQETDVDIEYQAYCYDYIYARGNYPR